MKNMDFIRKYNSRALRWCIALVMMNWIKKVRFEPLGIVGNELINWIPKIPKNLIIFWENN